MSKRLFVCVVLLASLVPAVPASATGPTSFSLVGRGFGHGRGMGQWGAKALADAGKSYSYILGRYYAGVGLRLLGSDPAIRVHVGTLPAGMIGSASPFNVYEIGGTAIATGTRGVIRVRPASTAMVVERSPDHDGPWTRLRTTTRSVGFAPTTSMLHLVETDGGRIGYRGSMAVHRNSAGTVWVIVTSGLQEYLRGVVPREMPSSWAAHALRAQAVAARTYAVRAMQRSRARGLKYDICSTTTCQVFGGALRRAYAGAPVQVLETTATNDAVAKTRRVVMTYGGEVILAEYSSSTGGYTAPGNTPYLMPRPDSPDGVSPHHTWSTTVQASKIETAYPAIGDLQRIVVTRRNGYGTGDGRALEVLLDGASSDVRISGLAFRRATRIRSDWFFVRSSS